MRRALTLLGLSLFAAPLFAQQPARPAITGIAFFRDYSTQPAAAEHFYGPTMGFSELKSSDHGETLVFAINHSQWVEVLPNTPPPRANRRMAAVGFTTRDVKAMERYLNAKGVATAEPMHDGEFAVRDPEGILVYFVESPYATAAGDKHLVGIAKQVSEAHELPSATSERMIHVGFIVQSADAENAFWRQILGFKPYWHGYAKEGETTDDYVSIQVPDGTDWIEYMLHQPADPDLHTSGVMDHFSLGTPRMQDVLAGLQRNGCTAKTAPAFRPAATAKCNLICMTPTRHGSSTWNSPRR